MPEISAADARKRSSVRTDLLSTKRHRVNLIRNRPLGSRRDGERIARLPDTIRSPNIRRLRLYARRRVLSPCRVSRESCSPLSSRRERRTCAIVAIFSNAFRRRRFRGDCETRARNNVGEDRRRVCTIGGQTVFGGLVDQSHVVNSQL